MILSNLLRGEKVYLSALSKDDAPTLAKWRMNSAYLRLSDTDPARPFSPEATAKWIEEENEKKDLFAFGIRLVENDALIGDVGIGGIEWHNGVGEIGIGIGDEAYWGKGYGTEAIALALRFAFWEINLWRVQLDVFDYNPRAIAAYEKLGFVREGVQRQRLQRDGKRYDLILYGLLRPEWEALNVGK